MSTDPDRTSRRGFFVTVGAATAGLTVVTAGQSVAWLSGTNLFAPREPRQGPQSLAVNRTAAAAGVEALATDPGWRLTVTGARTVRLGRDELLALPQTSVTLPIACVEGWSTSADWAGVRVRDLLALVDGDRGAPVRCTSLEPQGVYRTSDMGREFAQDDRTLVALRLNGEDLDLDHGFPARLIAPARPGVRQTKWLTSVEAV
ncbi:molybdopterin-dependent oxidoreductase [Microlunatus flavus]|uniref:Oxidoreductase molybdopterin binding domain-containing protein n=1 Tax=Microlunatus flavus TaxID=1036181 RepID=A0A1H9GCH7_9ACTN|nr:molybdopterin-dependent oxidoreductase [Microlunatus flavus]SEQ47821.1 Oxidoreductase molybdopterin binding domain-containing protein [Microlunatus flavus]